MFTATAHNYSHTVLVTAYHMGKEVAAWELPAKKAAHAKRLVRAIEAGKAVTFDKDGVKSVHVMGRYLEADLKRLGF
jgi:hypothetical protein